MGCVNRNGKEFKTLAQRNDVSIDNLELIVHKYWLESGSEDSFPSDTYIQAQLGNMVYQEPISAVRKLWKQRYSSSLEYNNLGELNQAKNEALKFFPNEAISQYINSNGKYVLSIKEPVAKVTRGTEIVKPKKLNLNIEEGRAYSIDKVKELFNRFNTDRTSKFLAEKVFKIADDMGLAITFENLGREGEATIGGKFSNGKVQFNKNFFENDTMNHRKAWVLLHELIHAETTYALDTSVNGSKALQEFKSEINNIFYQLKDRGVLEGWYGMANTHEFVAELANPVFRQKLQEIDKGEVKNSAWARIVEAIKKFLGLHTSSTYYNRAMKALDNALNAFDLDAYLEYNDIMSSLKDGMKSHNWKFTRMNVEQQRAALREHFMETMNFKDDLSPELKNRLKQAEKAAKAERKDIIYAQENDDTGSIQRQIAESRKQNFETLYGDVLNNVVIFKTTKGGLGVSATLKSFEELLRDENKDLVRQLNWVDNLSNDDVLSLTSLLEQDLRDYDLVYNNSEFDKSDIKDKDALISYIGAEDSQVIKGELGVNKEQLIALLGSTMYKANVQTTAVKELLQNAFDAVKIAQSQGKLKDAVINIDLNEKSRTVTISDNGTGMSPEIIQKAFFTIGGSHKGENVDNRLKSGGLGLAKMAFLFSSDYVEVTTVKDGIQTYVKATPEEIQSDNFNIITKKVPGTPSGTTVTVRIPEYYLDQNGEKRTIWFNSSPTFLTKPMIGNVTVNVTKSGSWWDNSTKSSNKNKIPEGYISVGKATSAFGDLDIYIAPIDNPDSSYLNNEILISGLYQFDHGFRIEGGGKARFKTIINILPTVDVKSQVYPINNQREDFRTTIEPEVKDLNFLLLQINSMLEKKSVNEMFNNTISMDVRDVSDIRRIPPTPKEVALNDAIKEVKKQFSSPTQTSNDNSFELKAAATTLRERALSEKSRNSSFDASGIKIKQSAQGTVDTSKLDIRKPIFHNNTTMVIEEDGQKVLNEFGALLMELKSLYLQTYKGQDIPTREGENITDYIEKQYWGFSFDKDYGGVNVSPKVIRLLAINPFYRIPNYKNTDIALQLTARLVHIIEHEFNHNYVPSEDAKFTGRFPSTESEFAGIGKSFNKDWKNKLYVLIRDNLQTFIKYNERYENSTNRGESLQGGKYIEVQPGRDQGSEGYGRDIQRQARDSQDVRDNGQGFGEEFADLYETAEKLSNQQHLEGDDAVAWLNEGNRIQDITDRYIQEHGNKLDADDVRKAFIEIGYDGTNVPEYQKAINILMNNIYDALLDKAIKEGKKSITFVSGVAGSGKSTAIKNNRNLDLSTQGVIYDAPFNNFWTFDKAIAHAWAKGMEKISIVQMYNDAQTAFENSVRRGYETGRFLNLQYFEDSFRKNAGKLERIHSLYPQVQITAIDNTGNNGGRMVTLEEALNWDYSITEQKLYNLLKYLENELNSGRLQGHQASSVTRDIQQITSATSPRIQEIIRRIEGRSYEVAQHNIPETGSRGLGLTSEEFYTKQDALDYINDLVNVDGVNRNLIDLKHTPETDTTDEYWTVSVREQPSTNPAGFRIHSGGAHGSDHYWGAIGEKYGIPSNHYYFGQKTPFGNKEITQQDYDEGKYEVAKAAAYNYGYKYPTMKNSLLIRNWAQVKYADAVFAIGHLVRPGEKLFPNLKNDTRVATNAAVTGGTGYAIAMAILHNKPVYVFDQTREKWYKNINGQWSESEVPTLTSNFAGIGTREINDAGRKAIEDAFKNTFKNYSDTSEKETLSADNVAQQTRKSSYNKISSKETPLQIYSDGSDIKGTGNIGYGSVFELDGKEYGISGTQESEEVKKLQEKFPDAKFSNPTMEMLALTTTLEHFANVGNGEDIVINQDYKGAVNYQGLWEHSEGSQQRDTKAWKAKEPYIAHLVERASTAIDKIVKDGGSVKINWVKGHQSGTSEQARMNNAADRFAKSRNISNNINDAYEKQNTQQQPIQQNLPGPETKINIYAGTNENADLSNFAVRPFTVTNVGDDASGPIAGNFKTVEGAFQAQKLAYNNNYTDAEEKEIISKLEKATGSEARKIGRNLVGLNVKEWDKVSSGLLKNLLKDSFEQNPQALQRLLATGNATLTHTQDKGKWGTEFPRLLMEVRDELREQLQTAQQQNQVRENRQEPQFTKVNDDFATTLINHLRNDKLEGYESVPKRAALVRMAETLFDYFKKNDIKVVITNAPYSDTEKGRSSAVTTDGKYAAIFYQEADLQGGKYLNILHELLHIATNNAIPFDWEGRAIADEKLQMYYDLFKRKLQEDKEWKDIQGIAIARSKEIYDRASDRAKILAHAYSKAGEFVSCAISNVEVQRVLESITYGETQASNLFEELRNWFKEVLEKIFHGYSYIAHENFLDDVTDFLLNTKYTDNTPVFAFTEEEQKAYDEYLKSIEDRYNNAKDFVNPNITRLENIPEKNSNFVIQLPNYQNYYGMTEVEVDAQWKVDELNSLEEEFTQDMTNEEREELISKMDKVLSSLSKEEYLKSKTKKEQQIEKNLDEYDNLTDQITNLMESNLVTASEVRHIAELVINAVSDDITAIQKDPGLVSEWFPPLNSELDFRNATRREIVDAIGIMNLLDRAKRNFDPATNEIEYDTFEDMDIAQEVILPNWNGIIRLASTVFAENEGFGISMNFSEGKFETTSEANIGIDDSGEYKSIEDVQEKEGDAQEYWQIESRTIDVLNTMSQLVRLALHQAYLLDKDGNKVLSKWGIPERVSTRKAVNNILRWTQKSQNLPEMIEKLSEKAKDNPWIQQIIDRLSDKSGNEADFQSQFYSTFQKHYQLYSIVKGDNGTYSVMIVNEYPALTQTLQNISSQFQAGLHPLFTTIGTGGIRVKRDSLGFKSKVAKDDPFTLYKALSELEPLEASLKNKDPQTFELDADNKDIAVKNITGAARILGFYVSEDLVEEAIGNFQNIGKMTQALRNLVTALEAMTKAPLKPKFNPFKTYDEDGIRGYLSEFLLPMTDLLEDDAITAFYDSGKMYQSYVTPSFTTKLMNKFKIKDKDEYRKFINEEYGQSEWYYGPVDDEGERSWRFGWMKLLGSNSLDVFDHKVQLNFNSHNYMKTMNDNEYTLSLIAEYFAYKEKKNQDRKRVQAWFRAPMESNKPSSEFFRFYSDRSLGYKDNISNELYNLFLQEAARIITVKMRDKKESDPDYIKNWDKNGKKFTYLQFLNSYLEDTTDAKKNRILLKNEDGTVSKDNETLAKLIQAYINREEMSSENSVNLITLTTAAIKAHMQQRADKILADWERKGIVDAAMTVANAGIWETTTDKDGKEQSSYNTSKEVIRERLENFIWNDKYAAINILQLMVGDTALYKDAEDLQKRLAQLHSPGIRANKDATDYQGRPVSDGKYRTILIKDFDPFKSNIIANLTEVFNRRIAEAPESERPQWEAIKDDLLRKPGTRGKDDKGGRYWRINVTDGQGYSSLSSYRKKAFMFGRWSRLSEDVYNKIRNNDYTFTELETAFQPLKPFVYTHLQKHVGVEGSPISTMNIAFQAKNSEYLLIMADALLQNEKTERPNLLRAISRIMEDSERLNPTKGIDTVQYGSAIKSGLQAEIDLTEFVEMPNGEEEAYKYMRDRIYRKDDNGNITNQYDTDVYVHETSYDDYCLQQDVPEHFKDHEQAHGSQERMILPSDLPFWKDENGPKEGPEAESNINYYEWDEINEDGEKVHRKLNAIEFRKAYEENIAKGIEESIKVLEKELGIDKEDYDKRDRNIRLSKILQREIISSPRYGIDLLLACSVDKETGEFRIPLGDPIQAKRIEQLINSIIKNRINKQTIAGGPIVQVTNFGTSRQLHIRFNAKSGGLLMMESEFQPTEKYKTYDEYKKAEQAGIAYFEVFAPAWSKDMLEKFMNDDGTIDIEAIEATDPELLKMISYRIPTEDKYSMAPMKIVGFMPRWAGDAIMLPYELTEIDDSDFDVDKRYVMRKVLEIVSKPREEVSRQLETMVANSYKKTHEGNVDMKWVRNEVSIFLDDPIGMRNMDALTKAMYNVYKRIGYTTKKPKGKDLRDNRTIDMSWAVLTNQHVAPQILNPGGFDDLKKVAYKIAAEKNKGNTGKSWEDLDKLDVDNLKKLSYKSKDITWIDDEIRFYKQNAAGSNLIGVFAVNKVAHAILEGNGYHIAVDEICKLSEGEYFEIAGKQFGGRMELDPRTDDKGRLIGKVLGSGVSASADTSKDPIWDLINVNMTTASVFNTLVRLGINFEDAALFMSQDIITKMLAEHNKRRLSGDYITLDDLVDEYIVAYKRIKGYKPDYKINGEDILSREELLEGLFAGNSTIDYKVMLAFKKLRLLAEAVKDATFATRFNSISSAVGPQIVDNLIIEYKMDKFRDRDVDNGTHFYDKEGYHVDIDDILYDHPILSQFARTVDIARKLFEDMPAMSVGFQNILNLFKLTDGPMQGLDERIFKDRKLLSKLADFYQSYLLVASGVADPSRAEDVNSLSYYIDKYPAEFMDKVKKRYPNNKLIQSIELGTNNRTGKVFLYINTTGMDQTEKDRLSSAWIDFHRANPEQSRQLFLYNFFRAGVGFSPKSFMSLVPTYVKERIFSNLTNGDVVSYVDTYRRLPSIVPQVVLDQFIANNWSESKLAPWKCKKGSKYKYDFNNNLVIITDKNDLDDLRKVAYMKTSVNRVPMLWKRVENSENRMIYELIKPLGNNGEYIEMSYVEPISPMNKPKEALRDDSPSDMPDYTTDKEIDDGSPSPIRNDEKAALTTEELIRGIMLQNPSLSEENAQKLAERAKKNPGSMIGFLENVFSKLGYAIKGKENIKKEMDKIC